MANTNPVNDHAAVTEYILDKARAVGFVQVFPIGAVSVGLAGERLAEIGELKPGRRRWRLRRWESGDE